MKIFNEIGKSALRLVAALAVACPLVVACYDDSELWEQVNDLAVRVLALEEKLNVELKALNDMLSKSVTISSCDMQKDSTYLVKLSTGVEFVVDPTPAAELKSVVTYINIGGVDYWAYYDEKGNKVLLLNEKNERVPVIAETPRVITKDDESWLVIGGAEYPLSGNSVFSNYELKKDELTGEVYAVTFTFGEEMSFTVTVDGAQGFWFVRTEGYSTVILNDYFVSNGMTERVQTSMVGVADYVLQVPQGWKVSEFVDEFVDVTYFDITAPEMDAVASGQAEASGMLKVMAVLEGGKATVAKLYLSTSPFSLMNVSLGKAYMVRYPGLQKFVYGLSEAASFDEDDIYETAKTVMTADPVPAGYGYADELDINGIDLKTILGSDLTDGSEYVLWALPVVVDPETEDYVLKKAFAKYKFKANTAKLEVVEANFRGATLKMSLTGADSYYAGLELKSDFDKVQLLRWLNMDGFDAKTAPLAYEGSAFKFVETDLTASPDTEYTVWMVVAEEGKSRYSEEDILAVDFKIDALKAGGNVTVTPGNVVCENTEITVPLTAAGAELIFYDFVKYADFPNYADEASQIKRLMSDGEMVSGEEVTAKLSDVFGPSARQPESDFGIYAVAVDADGKYGAVFFREVSTSAIAYNDLEVALSMGKNEPDEVTVNISVTGGEAVSYIYWIGEADHSTWTNPSYLNKNAASSERYMALNQKDRFFTTTAQKYPIVDGVISMKNLALNEDHVVVAVAVDDKGLTSRATVLKFKTRSVSIGNVVPSTDNRWSAAKPVITFLPEKFEPSTGYALNGTYAFTVQVPIGFTAYVLAATDFYFAEGNSVENMIVEIIEYVDAPRDNNLTVYPLLWEQKGFPYGHEFYHYEHGCPLYGNVVLWASKEYHDSVCDCGSPFTSDKVQNNVPIEVDHILHINDGSPVEVKKPGATGSKTEVVDKVYVVCRDLNGNCYEPFITDVPFEYFANSAGN